MNESLFADPLFGVSVTVIAYALALGLRRKWPWLHPLFVCCILIILLLRLTGVSYANYAKGGKLLEFLLGPATIALGVPIYRQAGRIKRELPAIVTGIAVGAFAAMAAAGVLTALLGGTRTLIVTMMPKSATTPISMAIVKLLGGDPKLVAVLTVLTGLFGSMFGPRLLRWAGVRDPIAVGAAIGTSSHGIGTARILRDSELAGSVSGFAMGLSGILTSLYALPVYFLWHP